MPIFSKAKTEGGPVEAERQQLSTIIVNGEASVATLADDLTQKRREWRKAAIAAELAGEEPPSPTYGEIEASIEIRREVIAGAKARMRELERPQREEELRHLASEAAGRWARADTAATALWDALEQLLNAVAEWREAERALRECTRTQGRLSDELGLSPPLWGFGLPSMGRYLSGIESAAIPPRLDQLRRDRKRWEERHAQDGRGT